MPDLIDDERALAIDLELTERRYKAALGVEAWKIVDAIADRAAAQLTSPAPRVNAGLAAVGPLMTQAEAEQRAAERDDAAESGPGWRAGIEASIRRLEAMGRLPRDLWQPAYFAAVDEALVHLRAMLERGTERVTTPVAGDPR